MTSDQSATERDTNLRRLLLIRVGIGTALLLPVLYFQLQAGSETSLAPAYTSVTALLAVSVVYALLHRRGQRWSAFPAFQLTVDTILATMMIYVLGGIRSPFVLLYLIIAFGAGLMTARQTSLAIACFTGVSYGLMAHLDLAGWLPDWHLGLGVRGPDMSPAEVYLRIFSVLLSSCLVAAVSAAFSVRLQQTRQALQHERSALESMQQLNQQLLAGMSSGLIAADGSGTIVACNRAAVRITGREEADLVGANVLEVLGFDAREIDATERGLEEGQIYRTERQLVHAGGEVRTIGVSVTRVVDASGPAVAGSDGERVQSSEARGPWSVETSGPIAGGHIFMFQDLTDIKRMERLFSMRERMALLGEMASSLAHEIRNPLASISGSLQVLRAATAPSDNPRSARLMEIVTSESSRLSKIIEDFLDYARPEKLEAADQDLVELVRETFELLAHSPQLLPEHDLEVESEGPVTALVDAARIKQVFWNLALNAVEAMPEGGRLSVRLRATPTGARVTFQDTGPGMSREQIDSAFRPFVSGKAGGTGLGLATVYRIMQQHGARIEVQPAPGRGTQLILHFENAEVPDGPLVVVGGSVQDGGEAFSELSRAVRAD